MRYSSVILMLFFSCTATVCFADAMQGESQTVVVKTENQSTFKGLLYQVWGRLRALNPQLKTNKTRDRTVATMGIRGAETTTSLIEPYWKGDKTDDPGYITELTRYTQAQQYAEDGDLPKAVTALNSFLEEYQHSDLRPNAQFALGISQGGMGDVAASKKTLQSFIDDNPKHPLVADARQVITELQ
jgi:TolA-binding protein